LARTDSNSAAAGVSITPTAKPVIDSCAGGSTDCTPYDYPFYTGGGPRTNSQGSASASSTSPGSQTEVAAYAGTGAATKRASIATTIGTSAKSATNVGFSVGGGFEWMFTPNWSLKAEGLYYYLGSMTMTSTLMTNSFSANMIIPSLSSFSAVTRANITQFAGLPNLLTANINTTHVRFDGVIARAGVNYHFNWGGAAPVVANY
jgi:opacity protein-like surface antigen